MPVGRAIDELDAGSRRGLARHALPFELRLLVDVAGPQRRILVGRRMLDVAVHADRAAVHDAPHAGRAGRLDRASPTAVGVDRAIQVVVEAGLPIERGDVVDDVDAVTARRSDSRDR